MDHRSEPLDDGTPEWSGQTDERAYYLMRDCFIKRTLRLSEARISPRTGEPIVGWQGPQRLQNEAACLRFIRRATNIPVPTVYGTFTIDDSCFLITERVGGISMRDLPEEKKKLVWPEIERHLATLRDVKSSKLGGPSGLVIPPLRVLDLIRHDMLPPMEIDAPEFVFCHNDLAQHNILVDPETLKIVAIIDWEFSGFFPPYFEHHFYKRVGPTGIIRGEPDDVPQLLAFFWVLYARRAS